MNCNTTNGRVNIMDPAVFTLTDKIPVNQCASYRDAMTGNWQNTILSDAYFSKENIRILQNGIRSGVYKLSNGQFKIGEQSCDELKIIMRSIFLQNSKNLATDIPGQISRLNQLVLDYAVKQVYGEAEGYMKYKRDASTLAIPISHPVLAKPNDKQLFLKKFI